MLRTNRMLTILVLVTLLVSACRPIQAPAPNAAPAQTKGYTPRYEPADCFYEIPEGDNVACGYLTVPEDRSHPEGRMIKVHVVNFKSKSATPVPDPIILVPGGPGSARGLYIYLWTAAPVADVMRANRDVIMIEHRGANYSEPAFYCPEMEADLTKLAAMSLPEEIAWSAAAYQACGKRLAQENHKLSAYGSLDAAADIADLRIALGYAAINVYGVSYGTLPAMHLIRDYPAGIRSVILDSVWPPEINQTSEMLKVTQGLFQAIFKACGADAACNAAYPDLEKVLATSLAALRAKPVTVKVTDEAGQSYAVTIDDLKFLQFILDSGYVGEDYAKLPAAMYTAHQGDLTPVAQDWLAYLSGRHGKAAPGTSTWSMGLFNTVTCLHDGSTSDVAKAKTSYAELGGEPSLRAWAEQAYIQEWLGSCAAMPITLPAPPQEVAPVKSDLPTLMWVNTFDIFLPPFVSAPAAKRLPHSYLLEFPRSHAAVFSPCALETLKQFLADPTKAPDASCIKEMKQEWVLPK